MPEPALAFAPALPEIILLVSGLVLLVVGAFKDDAEGARIVTPLAALALVLAGVTAFSLRIEPIEIFSGHFVFDRFASLMKVLVCIGAAGALMLSSGYFRDNRIERFEYPVLAVFATLGMCMMLSANSLLAMYMALELQSLPLYVMAAFNRDTLRSSEAGLKYFVLGALSSGMLIYGCSLVYGFGGTIMFADLAASLAAAPASTGLVVGLVFVVAGLAFKLAAVPFHMWTPDVYEGAPTPVTAFFAAAPKIAAMGLTLRVLVQTFGEQTADWQQVIVFVSVASMLLGAFAAIGQTNIKRLMAYSGIGHIGYALVGLAAGTEQGVYGVIVYLAIYLFMTLGTFACILAMRRQGRYLEEIDDLAGLSNTQPLMALALAALMFSLAGIPPLAGFFGKLYVFLAAVDAGLVLLAVIGLLTSVVGAYYYLRIVKLIYFDPQAEPFDGKPHAGVTVVAGLSAVFVIFFILLPGPLLNAAGAAAAALVR